MYDGPYLFRAMKWKCRLDAMKDMMPEDSRCHIGLGKVPVVSDGLCYVGRHNQDENQVIGCCQVASEVIDCKMQLSGEKDGGKDKGVRELCSVLSRRSGIL